MKSIANALYCCCIDTPWVEAAHILDREYGITPAYYIGWSDDGSNIKKRYRDCYFQSVEDAWKGLGFPQLEYSVALDMNSLKNFGEEHLVSLRMMDRLDITRGNFPLAQREIFFYHLLRRWLVILKKFEIDILIFPVSPHRVFDYVLYIAGKMHGIKTIIFQMTPFSDYSYIVEDTNHLPIFIKDELRDLKSAKGELQDDIKKKILNLLDNYEENIPSYMKENIEKSESYIIQYVRKIFKVLLSPKILFEADSSYYVQKEKLPYETDKTKFEANIYFLKNYLYLGRMKKYYESICDEITLLLKKRFVLFALHYQPEETSCPTGGFFGDQVLLLSLLDAVLPEGVSILVKEHTSQFLPAEEGASSRFPTYYDEMKRVSSRVRFVSTSVDPFTLIDAAEAVVTISGTIGWESAIRGTPVLHFGRAWYECMPGTFRIDGKESLERAIEAIFAGELRYDMEDIMAYHEKLSGFFISAVHYKAYEGRSRRSMAESAANLAEGIVKYLESSKETHVKSSRTR